MSRGISRITSIVPTIEGRRLLLLRSIGSLLDQELPEGLENEILISFDSLNQNEARQTLEAVVKLQGKASKRTYIRLISRSVGPGGVAEARNLALREATGEAIYFLDDDDITLPNSLSILAEWMRSSQAGFVAGDHRITEEDEGGSILSSTEFNLSRTWLIYEQLLVNNMVPMGAYLIRKDLIRRHFNPALRSLEDWLFLLDNINSSNVSICEELVVDIRRASTRAGGHRNPVEWDPQVLRDSLLIYGLHPSTELSNERAQRLQQLEKLSNRIASATMLIAENSTPDELPAVIGRGELKYLILNKQETIQRSIFLSGGFEEHLAMLTCHLIEQTNKQGDIIDVGANQGTYSLAVAKRLKDRTVHAYEAQKSVFMHLCANVLINRCTNITPHHLAIGHEQKQGRTVQVPVLDPYSENYIGSVSIDREVVEKRRGISGIAEPWDSATAYESVPLRELDQLLIDRTIACIKIDVEGIELDVLQGAHNLLQTQRPLLLFESWPLEEFHESQAQLLEHLVEQGYLLLRIDSDFLAYQPDQLDHETLVRCLRNSGLTVR
jgi:FkbM family methyltransferase